ncbi:GNAT family N-acetyltransferase [Nocardioides caldifontis]|uniref:GNAT family N-acetyltransferase n=1 Tax=Nocardioides caldifontis TaxID=2588938 RepID=UPI0011DF204A|nr:GNAT family N-acetyltransferase [Nocardioides caldifontis]
MQVLQAPARRTFSFVPALAEGATVPAAIRGGTAFLRPLGPGERSPLEAVFEASSAASREARYLAPLVRLPGPMLAALTSVDGCRHDAWLATVDGEPAGVARYVRVDERGPTAELAFEVVDRHQGRGLGAVLLDTVTTVAVARGVRRVQATVGARNARSLQLLAQVGLHLGGHGAVLEDEAPLRLMEPARVERPAILRLALARGVAATAD